MIYNRGFSLLETLVAVLILMTAVAGPLTIAYRGFATATVAKDQIIAFFLAQDALEYIRFARDTNLLAEADWLSGAGGTAAGVDVSVCVSPNFCYLDSTGVSPSSPQVCSGTCPQMRYDTTSNTYQYDVNDSITPFTRTIRIVTISSTEVLASTTISWVGGGGITRSVTLFENLFNWQTP